MDKSPFSLYRADGRPHGGGGVMVWAGVCYGQRTRVHFIDTVTRS